MQTCGGGNGNARVCGQDVRGVYTLVFSRPDHTCDGVQRGGFVRGKHTFLG